MLAPLFYLVITWGCIFQNAVQPTSVRSEQPTSAIRLDLNRATTDELERLPGIGRVLALRIVEHRRKHGYFKRPEDIIIVRGMSARRYRVIAHLIRI